MNEPFVLDAKPITLTASHNATKDDEHAVSIFMDGPRENIQNKFVNNIINIKKYHFILIVIFYI